MELLEKHTQQINGVWSLDKVANGLTKPSKATNHGTIQLVKATNAITDNAITGYSNGFMENQGIGSGAGYLESSNGTFTQIN